LQQLLLIFICNANDTKKITIFFNNHEYTSLQLLVSNDDINFNYDGIVSSIKKVLVPKLYNNSNFLMQSIPLINHLNTNDHIDRKRNVNQMASCFLRKMSCHEILYQHFECFVNITYNCNTIRSHDVINKKSNIEEKSLIIATFKDNRKLTKVCYDTYIKETKERIDGYSLRDAEYYIDMMYRRTDSSEKHLELQKLNDQIQEIKKNDQMLIRDLIRQDEKNEFVYSKRDTLRVIAQLIRYCKSQIYMNELNKARYAIDLALRVWMKQDFQPPKTRCRKKPCTIETLYHLIGVLSSLGMTRQAIVLEKQVELFGLHRFNLRISCDYFQHFDKITAQKNLSATTRKKIRNKAKYYFNMIFKSTEDKELIKWLIGPLTFLYPRKLKRSSYKLSQIQLGLKVEQYIKDNILSNNDFNYSKTWDDSSGGKSDKNNNKYILPYRLNLLQNNIDRLDLYAIRPGKNVDHNYRKLQEIFISRYASKAKPVIIQNLETVEPFLRNIRSEWSIENLKQKYGNVDVQIAASSDIANIQTLLTLNSCNDDDQNSKTMNISNYIDLMNAYNKYDITKDEISVDYDPPYLLRSISNSNNLTKHYKVPKIFNDKNRWDKTEQEQKQIALFSIGPRYSYTSFHMHSAAFNFLTLGAKKWLLCPPAILCSGNSDTNMVKWYKDLKDNNVEFNNIIEFTQLPGEMVYIPGGWSHAVINVDDISVGLAVELGWNLQYSSTYRPL